MDSETRQHLGGLIELMRAAADKMDEEADKLQALIDKEDPLDETYFPFTLDRLHHVSRRSCRVRRLVYVALCTRRDS